MVAVRFRADYRGVLTGERYYQAGAVAEFDKAAALALVEAGRADLLEPDMRPGQPAANRPKGRPRNARTSRD